MNRLFLMRNPEVFQGQKYLGTKEHYFEGWYFKHTNHKEEIAFIPGISLDGGKQKAFVQIITSKKSYYVHYDICDFQFRFKPFGIKIGNNIFSKERIHIDIQDKKQKLKIYGDLKYSNRKNIHTNILKPNIMGPFSYIPFMECNHAILSMKHKVEGVLHINRHKISFHDGDGYIEKDWGCSFPKSYVWCQGNSFQNTNASFLLSIAHIPFKVLEFRGFICSLIIGNHEFQFTTYNHAKIMKCSIDEDSLHIILKKGSYILDIKSKFDSGLKLAAPVKGKMDKEILENITSLISVTLRKNNVVMFSDTSEHCGIEIVLK